MTDAKAIVDLVSNGVGLFQFVPPEGRWDPTLAGIVAVPFGLILAFWGARLLRAIVVLTFMAAGAVAGVRVAGQMTVDALFGVVIGGGLAALFGYMFYRWWVGMTTGLLAVALVVVFGGQRLADECRAFQDQRLGVTTAEYKLSPAAPSSPNGLESLWSGMSKTGSQFWSQRRDFAVRAAAVAGLAWLFGLAFGMILPRFTTVVVTSALGVLFSAAGVSLLLSTHTPGLWNYVVANAQWVLAAVGLCLVGSLLFQLTNFQRPPVVVAPVEPAK